MWLQKLIIKEGIFMQKITAKQENSVSRVFSHPFSSDFWLYAARELRSVRSLVLCALFVALRVALHAIAIPVGENLNIYATFFVNALGSMIYGPVLGLVGGLLSDTISALVFPSGIYFFPFAFIEMASSFIYGLFLYRARLGAWRGILSKFAVTAVCNLIMTPVVMYYYYITVLGKSYTLLSLPRVIKNVALFPLEAILLMFFLAAMQPTLVKMKLTPSGTKFDVKLNAKNIAFLVLLTLAAVAIVICYYTFFVTKK